MMRHLLFIYLLAASLYAQAHLADYAVVLDGPPLAEQVESRAEIRGADAQQRLARIHVSQRAIRQELRKRNVRVTSAVQTLANVVFVRATRQQAESLRGMSGVARVMYLPPIKRHLDR